MRFVSRKSRRLRLAACHAPSGQTARRAAIVYTDPHGRGRFATVALAIYALTAIGRIATTLATGAESVASGLAALIQLVAMIVAFTASLMWLYRVNANAHSFADGLSITPGWNVGWFFVPLANLWKPFEGVRETWQASEDEANWPAMPVPGLLHAWWGCWLVGNIVSNASLQIGRFADRDSSLAQEMDIVSSTALIAAAAMLIVIIGRLNALQRRTAATHVFA